MGEAGPETQGWAKEGQVAITRASAQNRTNPICPHPSQALMLVSQLEPGWRESKNHLALENVFCVYI